MHFRTNGDTEVVLEAWRRWGPDALTRFRGHVRVRDAGRGQRQLYLARDPLGIKPLYFLRRQGGVIFASELKAIVTAVGPSCAPTQAR